MVFTKGNIPWNKRKSWSNEVKNKISISNSNKSKETREKISKSLKLFYKNNPERVKEMNDKKRGKLSHRKGVSFIEEYGNEKAKLISQKISNTLRKNKNSQERDKLFFNNTLKKRIKERDNNTCQLCKRFSYSLHIHHIDSNKGNNNENNLVSLCPQCHGKTLTKNWWKYKIVLESGMNNYEMFIPEKSKLWLDTEYDNYIINIKSKKRYIEVF